MGFLLPDIRHSNFGGIDGLLDQELVLNRSKYLYKTGMVQATITKEAIYLLTAILQDGTGKEDSISRL